MSRRARRWVLAAVTFTLVLRLCLATLGYGQHGSTQAFHAPDSARYLALGDSLRWFDGFAIDGRPEVFRLPGFPLLLALAGAVADTATATVLLQALLGALTTWLCFASGRLIAGEGAGIAAAWIFAMDPGQAAWSSMVLTETLFTTLVALALTAALIYVKEQRRAALLWAVAAAVAAGYVRLIGYVLPFAIIGACAWLTRRRDAQTSGAPARPRRPLRSDVASATALAVVLLGAWHVRNGLATGYWGFSTQAERAAYFMGHDVLDSNFNVPYDETARALRTRLPLDDPAQGAAVAHVLRSAGLERIRREPLRFAVSYAAGIGTTLLHPGTGAIMRLIQPDRPNSSPSVTQMLILGRWRDAAGLASSKGRLYWLVSVPLVGLTLLFAATFIAAGWRARSEPLALLPCLLGALLLAASGGPDGDSRRRAPLIPLFGAAAGGLVASRLQPVWRLHRPRVILPRTEVLMTREQIVGMLQDYSTAMMVTHAQSGPLDCRPMHVAHLDPQGPLWFFASNQSRKVTEIRQNADVLLVMQNEHRHHGCVWGRALVVDEPARIQQFWREPYRAWFPKGQDDPDLVLITVQPHTVEFWDEVGTHKLRYVFEPDETDGTAGHTEEAQRDRSGL